jgi:hypothetical protein
MGMIDTALVYAALLQYAEDELDWGNFSQFMNNRNDQRGETYEIAGLGTVTIVDYHDYNYDASYADHSEDIWIVFDVQGNLYRAKGTHTSYVGSEWEPKLEIVEPKEKVITVYESVETSN